ncbi:MAG: 2-C-methyl-D-erythritol 4-phosphate cytidylyltransferase [Mangrovibacterium sp.]|nr:2-C-methyl-D-erythritol 4-phosphate cytidylyltransferase [Mangrovibacterium sp.]
MEKFALIVAGGSGSRMNSEIPKQFMDLAGKPVLMRTMERFAAFGPLGRLVVVLPAGYLTYWNELCLKHQFRLKHTVVAGGLNRFQSVKNGLAELPGEGLVFIHDGVRPLVSLQTIRNCTETAMEHGNAVPVMPVSESLRRINDNGSEPVDRERFFLVQTPQTFLLDVVKRVYAQSRRDDFTDDASVCEAHGTRIRLVGGNPENIKLTRPVDFQIAECLFQSGSGSIPR